MSPFKHAIRQLEDSLENASPPVADAAARVVLGLQACYLNRKDPAALSMCKRALADDVAKLATVMASDGAQKS